MPELVRKIVAAEIKALEEDRRTIVAVASTESPDRANDVIRADGWSLGNFMKNPVIVWGHDYSAPPVAKAVRVWTEGPALMFEAQFPTVDEYPFGDTIYRLIKGGYLRAFSVGFDPIESKDREGYGREYIKQELWEISLVTVPMNPEALVRLGMGGFGPEAAKSLEEIARRLDRLEKALTAPNPQPSGEPPADPPPAETPAPDPQLITRALAEALPQALGAALDKAVTKRINYHLGKVDA